MANNADERTPLVATVTVVPVRERYPHSTLRRFCTIALSVLLIVVVILFLVPFAYPPHHRHGDVGRPGKDPWWGHPPPASAARKGEGEKFSYRDLQQILLDTPSEERARDWSKYYTAGAHLAGKNLTQAEWTRDKWREYGVESHVVAYDVYINYPKDHALSMAVEKGGVTERFHASLEEDVLDEDPTSGAEDRIPTFHGYSASGNVTARYVYANFGTYQDFEDLVVAGVELEGKIALVKYGRIFRGLKIKRAQELGMVGCVIYTDPQEDGEITVEKGFEPYPYGPARQASSVQRGSAQFLSIAPGDPTTPGYPSKPGVPRQDPHGSIPSIPSLPISYQDALLILTALNGHGPNASEFNEYWQGGGLEHLGVKYNIGPSPPTITLNLYNEQEYVTTPLWNVIGVINGTLSDEVIVLGNHRDAWILGGAGDPNSGSAALMELIRGFGKALKRGWKPLRTIVFASWDGEEYGLIGSTEWVEEYLPWLSEANVAYLNVDVGARGPRFRTHASPLLNKAIREVTGLVQSPNQTVKGQTIRDTWDGHVGTMGSGSDFTAFQDYAGVASIDLGFASSPDSPVYHYHSNYDSFHWMDNFGDPGWKYHTAMTKLWGLLAAKLSETPIIPFNVTDYAVGLDHYLDRVIGNASASSLGPIRSNDFHGLRSSVEKLVATSRHFDQYAEELAERFEQDPTAEGLHREANVVNEKLKLFERQFLYDKGLDGRTWFKHVVFAPGRWTGYAGATFPGLVEAIEDRDEAAIERWTGIIRERIDGARKFLASS